MNRMRHPRPLTLALAALIGATALSGCLVDGDAEVYGTFYPMTFLAEQIAGDALEVGQIIPDGTEPHEWDPGVRDISRLGSARLVVAQSPEFETWLAPFMENLGPDAPRVLYTAEGLEDPVDEDDHEDHEDHEDGQGGHNETHDEDGQGAYNETHDKDHEEESADPDEQDDLHDHGDDPHTWLDPMLMVRKAAWVRDALIGLYPEHNETFRENTEQLVARLLELDEAFHARLADCETRNIVVQHDAFAYLAERYDFEVHSVVGLSPQAEPDPRSVARAVEMAVEHDVHVVFTETRASPTVMNAIAEDASRKGTQVQVRVLSPLERRSSDEIDQDLDYLAIMYNNLNELQAAMRCTPA